jgi:hypothetical protein
VFSASKRSPKGPSDRQILMHTLRPKDVPGVLPKFVMGGLIGVISACVKDEGEDDGGFIHWSQFCCILDNAVFRRSVQNDII